MPGMQQIIVTVSGNQIALNRDPVDLRGAGRNVQLMWILQTPGWTFAGDGIDINGNDGQFSQHQLAEHGSRCIWIDANSGGKTYKYTVQVASAGGQTLQLDPGIINEN